MTYWRGPGSEIGEGLAAFVQQFIGTQNTLKQQDEQRAQRDLDNAFRQQQAEEQRRQFDAQSKQGRDSQAFSWLSGQQQALTNILAKGGYAKGSPEYSAAEQGLRQTNGLMRRVINGEQLSPDDLEAYDTLMGNVGAVIGQGAVNIGGREVARDDAQLAATQAGTAATVDANSRANEEQPFRIEGMGYQNRSLAAGATVAEGTSGAQIADAGNRAALSGVQARVAGETAGSTITATNATNNAVPESVALDLDLKRFNLGDLRAKAPLVYEGMRLSNETAQQALDFNTEANPERLTAVRQQNEQTRQQIDQSADLFPWQRDVLKADLDLREVQVEIAEGTKGGTIDGQNSQNWQVVAQAGNPALFDRYVKDGLMTPQQAAPYKRLAEAVARQRAAQVTAAEAGATTAQSQARVQTQTEGAQVRTANAQATGAEVGVERERFDLNAARQLFPVQLASARTALESAQQQLNEAREGRPYRMDLLRANVATAEQALTQNAQLFGPQLAAAQLQVQRLRTEVSVLEQTAPATVRTANAQASTAESGATSAAAQARVDVATIPAQIAARNLAPQQAQAALNAQLAENRFADATFTARVRQVDLTTSQGLQQLLSMKQAYSQNAAKFKPELAYLNAQTAVMQAQAQKAVSENVSTSGGVTDKKTVLTSLDAMRKINADERRIASTNLQNVAQRLMPNAKFSIDKYDPKSFTTLVASTGNLTPEQKQELQNAQLAYDTAAGKSSDLSTAFAQVSGKGRMDPKLAERLGFFDPGDSGDPGDPYGTQTVGGVKMVTKFTGTAPVPRAFGTEERFHVSRVASNLGIDPNALAAVISFETSGTFSPNARNPGSSATGLIQFMGGTGGPKGTYYGMSRDQFGKLPFGQQMEYVGRYLKERGIGPGSGIADVYAAVTGSGYRKDSPNPRIREAYDKNKVWDANGDGVIEKGEQVLSPQFQSHVRSYFGPPAQAGPVAPTATPSTTPPPSNTGATAPPPQASVNPLTQATARPFIMQAKTPAELERVKAGLIAGGMPADKATEYIRNVRTKL